MEQSEIRQGARDMLAPGNVNEQLEEKISDRPLATHLLELPVLFKAVAIAAVVTLISLLLFSPAIAAFLLILTFFGSWVFLAHRDYDTRRPTRPASEAEVKEGEHVSAH
jgi:hypothetical protein